MSNEIPNRLLDKRTQNRHVAAGRLGADALKKHIDGLPDLEAEADNIAPALYADEGAEEVTAVEGGE